MAKDQIVIDNERKQLDKILEEEQAQSAKVSVLLHLHLQQREQVEYQDKESSWLSALAERQ